MPHYFSEDNDTLKSNPKEIAFRVNGLELKLMTDNGIFAKDSFDRGTSVLLEYAEFDNNMNSVLDLGCGYGVIGIYLSKKFNVAPDMIDVNRRAIQLTSENIVKNNAKGQSFYSDGFKNIIKKYDCIITNPPIRVGKKVMYQLLDDAKNYLCDEGRLLLVINKKHGALSAIKHLETIYRKTTVLGKNKGFYVLMCEK
jgi:16S rRNA (guanine1207-N2)-methyltransferase